MSAVPSSADVAAQFRGLTAAAKTDGAFCYTNCLGREYDTTQSCVRAVVFAVSRYDKYEHRIVFDEEVTEAAAIHAVEAYLSKPLTKKYYNRVRDDTFHQMEWNDAKEHFEYRGDVLTDCRFLEAVSIDEDGMMSFSMGS
jgi:hypothetical protein